MKIFGIRRCERCGTWLVARMYTKRKTCPQCGYVMLVRPKKYRSMDVYVAFADTLQEANELLKSMKGKVRGLKK